MRHKSLKEALKPLVESYLNLDISNLIYEDIQAHIYWLVYGDISTVIGDTINHSVYSSVEAKVNKILC